MKIGDVPRKELAKTLRIGAAVGLVFFLFACLVSVYEIVRFEKGGGQYQTSLKFNLKGPLSDVEFVSFREGLDEVSQDGLRVESILVTHDGFADLAIDDSIWGPDDDRIMKVRNRLQSARQRATISLNNVLSKREREVALFNNLIRLITADGITTSDSADLKFLSFLQAESSNQVELLRTRLEHIKAPELVAMTPVNQSGLHKVTTLNDLIAAVFAGLFAGLLVANARLALWLRGQAERGVLA